MRSSSNDPEFKRLRALVAMKNQSSVFAQSAVEAQKLINGRNDLSIDTINSIFTFKTTGYSGITLSAKTSTISGLEYINDISVDDIDAAITQVNAFADRVTAVEEALDGKADKEHTHEISDVTDLEETLTDITSAVTTNANDIVTINASLGNYVMKSNVAGYATTTYDLNKIYLRNISIDGANVETKNTITNDSIYLYTVNVYGVTLQYRCYCDLKADLLTMSYETLSGTTVTTISGNSITTPAITLDGTDLTETLDGISQELALLQEEKADKEHTHEISDVTDLQTTLDLKATTEDLSTLTTSVESLESSLADTCKSFIVGYPYAATIGYHVPQLHYAHTCFGTKNNCRSFMVLFQKVSSDGYMRSYNGTLSAGGRYSSSWGGVCGQYSYEVHLDSTYTLHSGYVVVNNGRGTSTANLITGTYNEETWLGIMVTGMTVLYSINGVNTLSWNGNTSVDPSGWVFLTATYTDFSGSVTDITTVSSTMRTSATLSVGALSSPSVTGSLTMSDGSINVTSGGINLTQNTATGTQDITWSVGTSDACRIRGGATASEAGYLEIATSDDTSEPIICRQYKYDGSKWNTIGREAYLLDASGNTSFPGTLSVPSITLNGTDLATTLDSISQELDPLGPRLSVVELAMSEKMNITNPTFTGTLNGFTLGSTSGTYNSSLPCIATIKSDGLMEIGRYLDWHYSTSSTDDYNMRMSLGSDGTLSMNKGLSVTGSINATSIGSTLQTLILNMTYPVGVVYTSTVSTSPATLFGGTWTQITDRFLYCTTSSKATGGSTAITSANLPSHSHSFSATTSENGTHVHTYFVAQSTEGYPDGGNDSGGSYGYWRYVSTNSTITGGAHTHTVSGTSGSTGSGSAYYPPYMTVYAWYRTA